MVKDVGFLHGIQKAISNQKLAQLDELANNQSS